jgi:hypothetical protein
MLGEGEYAFFGMFAGFVLLVLLGILANLHIIPGAI